ncbi:MAG: N-acetyltransferase [Candidatus Saccharibacteria bacterium]|nr:N-acetyltransferase [Candidatus Saccharibacteria bacterium]
MPKTLTVNNCYTSSMTETPLHEHTFDKTQVIVERAVPADAAVMCDIRDRAWLAAYPNPELAITEADILLNAKGPNGQFVPRRIAYLEQQIAAEDGIHDITMVAKVGGKVLGFVNPSRDEQNRRRIGALYVSPESQGLGIGGLLMRRVLEWWGNDEDIYLNVVSYNRNAIGFYEHFGFEATDSVILPDPAQPSYMKSLPLTEMVLRVQAKVA